jgi:hypothetical protein
MNISGYQDNNFHDGSTQILGDLIVDGKLTLGGATGQSEYLDSGDYTGTIIGVPSHWVSMGLKTGTQYRYEKNGNIIQVHLYLRGVIKANTQYPQISINVPSTDLFNVGHTGSAYVYSSFILPTGRQIYTTVNQAINTSGISGQTNILVFYEGNSATNNQETVDFFVNVVYKLIGADIPATVLVSGGTGQGNVQNPMLESLDAGGYDILNVGTFSATFISAPNILTNPLNLDLDVNNNKINNCSEIKTTGQPLRLIGGPLQLENDSGATDILVNNNFDMNGKDIKDVNSLSGVNGFELNITNVDDPVVLTGSTIELRSNPPNTGKVELYTNIDMKDKNIDNVSILTKTGAMEFKASAGYIFDNYVDFVTKRFNGVKYIKADVDFENVNNLFGVYVIVGNIVMVDPLVITGPCLISGYNNLSTLTFNITTGNESTYCITNSNNSGNIEFKDFVFTNQNTSTRGGILLNNSGVNTNILRVFNIGFYNCKNNYPLRILGFELAEILNCTFRYNYGGTGGAMLSLNAVQNVIIESCEFYNNYQLGNTATYYVNYLLYISGTCNNITITANQFSTYGALSLGGVSISAFGTSINRVIIDGNIFDAQGGSDPLLLLDVDTSIYKGVICNDNTGVVSFKASLEGLVNGNTVYTATQAGVWVPIDLTGFVTGGISRFVPGLSPYSFIFDASNPIKSLISINCSANHGTGGTDTVQLGLSVNGTVTVFIEADLSTGQTKAVSLTTVLNLNFSDTIQLVCKNITAATSAVGFRAVSLNVSLIEI